MQQQIQHWNYFPLVRTGFSLVKDEQTCEAYTLDNIRVYAIRNKLLKSTNMFEKHMLVLHIQETRLVKLVLDLITINNIVQVMDLLNRKFSVTFYYDYISSLLRPSTF
jgi:hypothetical protein